MRIAVEASAVFNQGAGIGRYARSVLREAAPFLAGAEWTLFWAPEAKGEAPFGDELVVEMRRHGPVDIRRLPFNRRRADQVWFRARIPLWLELLGGRGFDLVYSPDFTAPPSRCDRRLVTIHDLAFLTHPETAPGPLRNYLSTVVPRQVERATRVAVVSNATRQVVRERLGVPEEKLILIPNAVDERFFVNEGLPEAVRAELGLPGRYLLSVGTIEPRKNHRGIFAALRLLGDRCDRPLVVAGRQGWAFEPILADAEDLVRQGRVIFLHYVPDGYLPGLYAGAEAMIYPSWTEGFGLPILESLAAGTSVVAGDDPAMREVGGEVVRYVNPGDPTDIASAILEVCGDAEGFSGQRATRRAQARLYKWERSGMVLAQTLGSMLDAAS